MQGRRHRKLTWALLPILAGLLWLAAPTSAEEAPESFEEKLARVQDGLRKNPNNVPPHALQSCSQRVDNAVRLYNYRQEARARRALDYCLQLLQLSKERPHQIDVQENVLEEIRVAAARELEGALQLEPDLTNGLEIFRECARCHTPEGQGLESGIVPQIAGQHRRVVIKQLADIRAGHRKVPMMDFHASMEAIGGPQSVADVAGYIDTLEIGTVVGKGPGDQLDLGETIYREDCASCHGARGGGDAEAFVPRLHSQHFKYLVAQLERVRDDKRGNADPEMYEVVKSLNPLQISAVADYLSRLEPPAELQAPPGWKNPDFAE